MIKLKVSKNQLCMIETVEDCLAEANSLAIWKPVAISKDNVIIGFAMYGFFSNEGIDGRLWLDRFLIDEKYQSKGYSKQVIPKLLGKMAKAYKCDKIYLSVYENNEIAIAIYKKFGFVFNGEIDLNNEKVMELVL